MNHDPTPALLNKFQKELAKLRKKKVNATAKDISNCIHLMR